MDYRFYVVISAKLLGQAQEHAGHCDQALRSLQEAESIVSDPALKKNIAADARSLSDELTGEIAACALVKQPA